MIFSYHSIWVHNEYQTRFKFFNSSHSIQQEIPIILTRIIDKHYAQVCCKLYFTTFLNNYFLVSTYAYRPVKK